MIPVAQTGPNCPNTDSRSPVPNKNRLTDRSRDPVNWQNKLLKQDTVVATKETAVGEVTMKSMPHPECRADTAVDEPAMKTATAEPATVRARLRRGR